MPTFYRFLRELVEAGYGDRIMFGSDQMIWPGIIEPSIRAIEESDFLTKAQRRDIFYNNAARFLRLTAEEIARHHAMRRRMTAIHPLRTMTVRVHNWPRRPK